MNLFFCENIPVNPPLPFAAQLDEEESRHATKVMRLQPAEVIRITDGRGFHYQGMIIDTKGKKLEIRLTDRLPIFDFSRPRLHLAISPLKNPDRVEWLIEKATEAGIYKISFIQTHRTEKPRVNVDRLKRIAIAALKQSMGAWLPPIGAPMKFLDFLKQSKESEKFIAWCEGEHPLFWDTLSGDKDAVVLIGPEGDFTSDEVKEAKDWGFHPINLGVHRLRSETAGMVSIFAFQIKCGNL